MFFIGVIHTGIEMKVKKPYSRIYIEITNICNRNCSFCPGTVRTPRRMSEAEFEVITDKITHLTDYVYLHVMGEPLTHPELSRFIEIGKRKGLKVAITTNGTLLSTRGDEIISSGAYKVNISVHSFEGGAREDYLRYVEDIMDFADRASASGVLTVLRLWNKGYDKGRNIDTLAMLKERFIGEWTWGASGARIRDKLHLEYGERFEWPDSQNEVISDTVFCYGLGDHFGILVDGTVIPCCLDREGVVNLGNAFEGDVDSILSSKRAVKISDGFKNKCAVEELCKKCPYARRFKI